MEVQPIMGAIDLPISLFLFQEVVREMVGRGHRPCFNGCLAWAQFQLMKRGHPTLFYSIPCTGAWTSEATLHVQCDSHR